MIQKELRLFSSAAKVYKVMLILKGTFLFPTRIERTSGRQATTHSRRATTATRPIIPSFTKVLRKDNELPFCVRGQDYRFLTSITKIILIKN